MQFRRRRAKKTDYRQRLALLRSGKPRLVIRRSAGSFHLQVVVFGARGDRTIAEVASGKLREHGWKGHCGNLPAAYLAGLLIGKEARKNGVEEAVPDLGLQISVRGSALFACLLGARDAGLSIGIGKDAVPKKERIEGRHIAEYAAKIRQDREKFARQFGDYVKNGLDPEKLPEHFADIKGKIMAEIGKKKVEAEA